MRTTVLTLLLALLIKGLCFAQETWEKVITHPEGVYSVYSIVREHYDKGIILGGSSDIKTLKINKLDINGNDLWHKTIEIDGVNSIYVETLINMPDGGIALTGIYSPTISPSGEYSEVYLLKFNASMTLEWGIDFKGYTKWGTGYTTLNADDKGNIYISMQAFFRIDTPEENEPQFIYGKISKEGQVLWMNRYYKFVDGYDAHRQWDKTSILTKENDIIVGGSFVYQDADNTKVGRLPNIYKIDNSGNFKWFSPWTKEPIYSVNVLQTQGVNLYDAVNALHISSNGDIIAHVAHDKKISRLLRYSPQGELMDDKEVIYPEEEIINYEEGAPKHMTMVNTPNSTMTMSYRVRVKDNPNTVKSGLVKFDENLNVVKSKLFDNLIPNTGTFSQPRRIEISKTFDNELLTLVTAGEDKENINILRKLTPDFELAAFDITPIFYDNLSTVPIANGEVIKIKLDELTNPFGIETQNAIQKLNVYPNPANDLISIDIPEYFTQNITENNLSYSNTKLLKGEVQINIVDNLGKIVKKIYVKQEEGKATIDISNLLSGIYFVNIIKDGKIIANAKVSKI